MLPGVTKVILYGKSQVICFKLRSTWKLTSEIQFTKLFLPHRKINKSFLYFEGVFISRAIGFGLRLFPNRGKKAGITAPRFKLAGILRNKGSLCTWLNYRFQDNGHAPSEDC